MTADRSRVAGGSALGVLGRLWPRHRLRGAAEASPEEDAAPARSQHGATDARPRLYRAQAKTLLCRLTGEDDDAAPETSGRDTAKIIREERSRDHL
jgi:hypothetical protein